MPNLFFPQLSVGAVAQYPIKKTSMTRSITNLLPDGTTIIQADPYSARLTWQLAFTELAPADANALRSHFQACCGAYHSFTFIDPTDNMLISSTDLTASVWVKSPNIAVVGGIPDPLGGSGAFTVTNNGGDSETLAQELLVPANYQYCFSVYASSAQPGTLDIVRQGANASTATECSVAPTWNRVVSGGRLNDAGTQLTVGFQLAPGQQVSLYGPQLEPQIQPSRYRATYNSGGVYSNCHFTSDRIAITSEAPNLFSTSFTIQTNR